MKRHKTILLHTIQYLQLAYSVCAIGIFSMVAVSSSSAFAGEVLKKLWDLHLWDFVC